MGRRDRATLLDVHYDRGLAFELGSQRIVSAAGDAREFMNFVSGSPHQQC